MNLWYIVATFNMIVLSVILVSYFRRIHPPVAKKHKSQNWKKSRSHIRNKYRGLPARYELEVLSQMNALGRTRAASIRHLTVKYDLTEKEVRNLETCRL